MRPPGRSPHPRRSDPTPARRPAGCGSRRRSPRSGSIRSAADGRAGSHEPLGDCCSADEPGHRLGGRIGSVPFRREPHQHIADRVDVTRDAVILQRAVPPVVEICGRSCAAGPGRSTRQPRSARCRASATVIAVSELLWHDTQPVLRRNDLVGALQQRQAAGDRAAARPPARGPAARAWPPAMSFAPAFSNRSTIGVGPRLRGDRQARSCRPGRRRSDRRRGRAARESAPAWSRPMRRPP